MAYKQLLIPEVNIGKWEGLRPLETRKQLFTEYRANYQNIKEIKNRHLGITIKFIRDGGEKLAFGGGIYPKKATVIDILEKALEYAVYNNWGNANQKTIML